jgi:hypothetical protein
MHSGHTQPASYCPNHLTNSGSGSVKANTESGTRPAAASEVVTLQVQGNSIRRSDSDSASEKRIIQSQSNLVERKEARIRGQHLLCRSYNLFNLYQGYMVPLTNSVAVLPC